MSFAAFAVIGTALRSFQARFAFATPCIEPWDAIRLLHIVIERPLLRVGIVPPHNTACISPLLNPEL